MQVTLYEVTPSRSLRCRWTLLEAGIDYESVDAGALFGSDRLKKINPMGKLPAAEIDGRPLFESAAICTYLADQVPEKKLIAPSGTWARALHDQWTCFGLTEMEAYLWHTARNTFVLPEDQRVTATFEQNAQAFKTAAGVLDTVLGETDYLVENRFSVTDIIVGFTVNWGRRQELLDSFPNLQRYLDRLFERPHCTLAA